MVSSGLSIRGDFRTLLRVSLPLFLFLFCESSVVFIERIFLSHLGAESLSSSLNGTYLASIFQGSCMAIASMGLVFVGLYQGEDQLERIGPCVWQLIWFSLLSMAVTLPLGLWSSSLYFEGTPLEKLGGEYFKILAWGNFLLPLNTALTSFYIGRGKTLLVTSLMLASYGLNVVLCRVLIFGIKGFIPAWGIQGAPLARCLSLGVFCLIFFVIFLSKENRKVYGTGFWQFSPTAFWFYIRPGFIRAFGHIWWKGSLATVSCLMIRKGGAYLDAQTIGGTVIAFLLFFVTGLYRSVLAIAPNLLGSKNYAEIWRFCRSLMVYIAIIGAIIAVPLLVYPDSLIFALDGSSRELFEKTFRTINHWIWFYLVAIAVQTVLCALIIAIRDLKTQFFSYFLTLITSVLPIYLGLNFWSWKPDKFWLVLAIENGVFAGVFFYRLLQRKWEVNQPSLLWKGVIQNKPT